MRILARKSAAVAVILLLGTVGGTVFGSMVLGDAASATCVLPVVTQAASAVGVQIGTPDETPTPTPTPAATAVCPTGLPAATGSASPAPTAATETPAAASDVAAATGSTRRRGPAATVTAQSAPAGSLGAPAPGSAPVAQADPLTITPSNAQAGERILVTAAGYAATEKVQLVMYPGALILGSYDADSNGRLRITIMVPLETKTGPQTLEATGWVSHHATNGRLLVGRPSLEKLAFSSTSWIIGIEVLLGLMVLVSAFVFRRSIADLFTPNNSRRP